MGYDVNRFEGKVPDEFICTICHDVLQEPLVTPVCEHIFCGECIKGWLTNGPTKAEPSCPNDRTPATVDALKPPLRSFRNLLYSLQIRCLFKGCGQFVILAQLDDHEAKCMHNPVNLEKEFPCVHNCGANVKVQNRDKHNCVQYLKKKLQVNEQKEKQHLDRIATLEQEKANLMHKTADDKAKLDEKLQTMQNEIDTKDAINRILNQQMEQLQDDLQKLHAKHKNRENLASQALKSPPATSSAVSIHNNAGSRFSFPLKPAISPRNSNTFKSSHSTVENVMLVDLEDEFAPSPSALAQTSKFYSGSTSNLNGTVRSKEEKEERSSVVKSAMNLFNKFPTIPMRAAPPPPSPSGASNTGSNNSSSSSGGSESAGPSNGRNGSSSSATTPQSSSPATMNPADLVKEYCKKQRILQVFKLVDRRHFFPSNDYYKAVNTKRGAHSFALPYEIKLLDLIEPYISRESKVLDIGSGTGFLTVCLAQLAKQVVGVEHVKELVNRSQNILEKHYSELGPEQQNRVLFVKEDGRYGCQRFAPYDLILIEPIVRLTIPDILFKQLKPNGCIVAVVKGDSKAQMLRITLNSQRHQVTQTLFSDYHYLTNHNKDILGNLKDQELPFLNRIRNF